MPPDPKVVTGAAAIVERNGDYLMLQRGGSKLNLVSDGRGQWSFPGGWIEHGESARDAAVRECEEETGLFVRAVAEDGYTVNQSPSGFTVATLFVRCEYVSGDPINREPEKALAVQWMPREMLVELDLFAPLDSWWRRPR